ncbi:MAG: HNH endonuclease [Beijerinckiaceae bacterium]
MTKRPSIRVHGRSVQEWIGKTPDAMPPPSVRARIFDRCEGVCHISGRKILPGEEWHLDHIRSIRNGGENRESNLAPALGAAHRGKTAKENRDGGKADRVRRRHIGAKDPPDHPLKSRPREKAKPQEKASGVEKGSKLAAIMSLPRRSMFR